MDQGTDRQSEILRRLDMLRCPDCHGPLCYHNSLMCKACGREFYNERFGINDLTPLNLSKTKEKIVDFWGDTYQQWYEPDEAARTLEKLKGDLVLLEDLFRQRQHLAVTEMDLGSLNGKEVLEVGSGAGAHSALFVKYGAQVTATDITPERVMGTGHKLDLLRQETSGGGIAIRADAEGLPFADDVFDVVYSNGVLHHTENTDLAIREVLRVLKPGGEAIIMLYSRYSAYYWCILVPLGLLTGQIFRLPEAQWVGRVTEGAPRYRSERNPITRVYSKRQLVAVFDQFEIISLRKNSFFFSYLPVPRSGKCREIILRALGYKPHEGGQLVYGKPTIPETKLELWLGGILGWGWNIGVRKPKI